MERFHVVFSVCRCCQNPWPCVLAKKPVPTLTRSTHGWRGVTKWPTNKLPLHCPQQHISNWWLLLVVWWMKGNRQLWWLLGCWDPAVKQLGCPRRKAQEPWAAAQVLWELLLVSWARFPCRERVAGKHRHMGREAGRTVRKEVWWGCSGGALGSLFLCKDVHGGNWESRA